jgi:Arc/MetJ family transcription regulator
VTCGKVYADVYEEAHVRTNIVMDDARVREAKKLTGIETKVKLVDTALRELVKSRKRVSLLDLEGKIRFAPGYDYKKLRIGK